MTGDAGGLAALQESLARRGLDVDEEMLQEVYDHLRRTARRARVGHAVGETLGTTALVHEAWLKLFGRDGSRFRDRQHFYATAALAMRYLIVDHVRMRRDRRELDLLASPAADALQQEDAVHALDLHEALEGLLAAHPRQGQVVELRHYLGLTEAEVAELLGVTERTVRRDWVFAQAWLRRRLAGMAAAP